LPLLPGATPPRASAARHPCRAAVPPLAALHAPAWIAATNHLFTVGFENSGLQQPRGRSTTALTPRPTSRQTRASQIRTCGLAPCHPQSGPQPHPTLVSLRAPPFTRETALHPAAPRSFLRARPPAGDSTSLRRRSCATRNFLCATVQFTATATITKYTAPFSCNARASEQPHASIYHWRKSSRLILSSRPVVCRFACSAV
jgi:hypothetical protein